MAKYLVLSAKPYDFENDKGDRIQGVKLSYVSKRPSSREGEKGHPPMIASVTNMDLANKIDIVPAIYDLEFEQVPGKNNKPELLLVDVSFLDSIDLGILF